MTTKIYLKEEISGHDPQGAWCQEELIGSKLPIMK
jgi:hypothetical protein